MGRVYAAEIQGKQLFLKRKKHDRKRGEEQTTKNRWGGGNGFKPFRRLEHETVCI